MNADDVLPRASPDVALRHGYTVGPGQPALTTLTRPKHRSPTASSVAAPPQTRVSAHAPMRKAALVQRWRWASGMDGLAGKHCVAAVLGPAKPEMQCLTVDLRLRRRCSPPGHGSWADSSEFVEIHGHALDSFVTALSPRS